MSSWAEKPANRFTVELFWDWYRRRRLYLRSSEQSVPFAPQMGLYLSRISGQSLEFLDYAEYRPGDDPRLMSQRLFARTRRWFVKRMHHRNPIHISVLADDSPSMFFGESDKEPAEQKWVRQACFMGYLAIECINRGDTLSVAWRGGAPELSLSSRKDWLMLLNVLQNFRLDANWGLASLRRPRRSIPALTIVCGDFLFEDDVQVLAPLKGAVRRLAAVFFRHVHEERGLPGEGLRIQDMERRGVERVASQFDNRAFAENRDASERKLRLWFKDHFPQALLEKNLSIVDVSHHAQKILRWGERA